jgi:pilus assembly protein CpaF
MEHNMTTPYAIDDLLADPTISEIMINGYQQVTVERRGILEDVPSPYRDEAHLMEDIVTMIGPSGQVLSETNPIVDVRFSDGSLGNFVTRPITPNGPSVTLRKATFQRKISFEDLLRWGSLTEDMATFIRACVLARQNIVIAGGTGSGKTTVANIVADMIPTDERIVLCQETMTMKLGQPRTVILETWGTLGTGKTPISLSQIVVNAMKMRPDRILVAEVAGAEAFPTFQALNTGHDGSMFTMHATGVRNTLERLEAYIMSGSPTMPLLSVREMIANGLNFILYQERLHDGTRRLIKISEVLGMEGGIIQTQDIFEFRQTGLKGKEIVGHFMPTGLIPRVLSKMRDMGIEISMELFAPRSSV